MHIISTYLTAPSLQELEIVSIDGRIWEGVIGFLKESAVMLRVLRIRPLAMEPVVNLPVFHNQDFIRALKDPCFKELRVLELEYHVGLETIQWLTLPSLAGHTHGSRRNQQDVCLQGYLVHLERITLLTESFNILNFIESRIGTTEGHMLDLIESRIGTAGEEAICKRAQQLVNTQRFSLDIPIEL